MKMSILLLGRRILPAAALILCLNAITSSYCHAFQLQSFCNHHHHHHHHQSTLYLAAAALSEASSTLNEDGDFIMEGINDDISQTPSAGNRKQFTSLLDMEYNSNNGQQPHQQPPTIDNTILGLDENGDFMLEPPTNRALNDEPSSSNRGNPFPPPPASLLSESLGNQHDIADAAVATRSTSTPSSAAGAARLVDYDVPDMTIGMEILMDFLISILPSLADSDLLHNYALQLLDIGFDPDYESSIELLYEDLEFMKKLHQRYFWKEWNKLLLS